MYRNMGTTEACPLCTIAFTQTVHCTAFILPLCTTNSIIYRPVLMRSWQNRHRISSENVAFNNPYIGTQAMHLYNTKQYQDQGMAQPTDIGRFGIVLRVYL
eukprot:scpid84858/ scgid22863/ 